MSTGLTKTGRLWIGVTPDNTPDADNLNIGTDGVSVLYRDPSGTLFTVVNTLGAQTLENKTIVATDNTISGIFNDNIDAAAAIDATKIHNGSVSNTEFGYLDGVTSGIQGQLNAKPDTLSDLDDTDVVTPLANQRLIWNGTDWANSYDTEVVVNVVFADFTADEYVIPTVAGIYHINTTGASGPLTVKLPNVAASNDNHRVRIIKEAGDEDIYVTTVGGTQLIGTATTQSIQRSATGMSVVSHTGDNAYLIIQDSRQTFPTDGTAMALRDRTDFNNFTGSSGAVTGFAITKNLGAGTVDVATGEALLRDGTAADQTTNIKLYSIPAAAGLVIPDKTPTFICIDYNAGSPILVVTTDQSTINVTTRFAIGSVFRDGTTFMDVYQADPYLNNFPAKLALIQATTQGVRRSTGSTISSPSGLNLAATAGLFYSIFSPALTPAFNTATGSTFTSVYGVGSTWTRTIGQTALNNTQYNNAGVLTALSANRFGVGYLYWSFDDPSRMMHVYGTAQYTTLSSAQTAARAAPSSLPPELATGVTAVLIGAVITQQSNATTVEVLNVTTTAFTSTVASTHNNLAGLQGGSAGEYYHLTSANHLKLTTNALTASRPLATDGSGYLSSTTFATWVAGTSNQVNVADDGDGSITLSLPQSIHTGATPTFADIITSFNSSTYTASVNSSTDWTLDGDAYYYTLTAATHGRGTNPDVWVVDSAGDILTADVNINVSGDVRVEVGSDPDLRVAIEINVR